MYIIVNSSKYKYQFQNIESIVLKQASLSDGCDQEYDSDLDEEEQQTSFVSWILIVILRVVKLVPVFNIILCT